jgi:hypothetical protein
MGKRLGAEPADGYFAFSECLLLEHQHYFASGAGVNDQTAIDFHQRGTCFIQEAQKFSSDFDGSIRNTPV